MRVYHGGIEKIEFPQTDKSRIDIDFGIGFYLTADKYMAEKWACSKATSWLNEYQLDISGLKIKKLQADKEWLDYVVSNRKMDASLAPFDDSSYDIIIGPTADDRIFVAIDLYLDEMIPADTAIRLVNVMRYSDQVVIKNQKIITDNKLMFVGAKELRGQEKQIKKTAFITDTHLASERTKEILRELR